MKLSLFTLLLLCMGFLVSAQQSKLNNEKAYIKEMCGCYKVDFEYAETFSDDPNYEYHDRYDAHGLEWIFVDEESDEKIVLQHLLIVNDTMIVKHWRQDWLYENQNLLEYKKNLEWAKIELTEDKAAGTWTQKVYQVDESPRYEGYAHWINSNGRTYWESQVYAPLPRREFTKRSDYNVMLRNNKHKITEYGHVHELDNAKIIRTEDEERILVWEKGLNTYTKVEDAKCQLAGEWWKENRAFWVDVREVWAEITAENNYINLKHKVEDQKLWQRLFALGKKYESNSHYKSNRAQKEIREIITLYLSDEPSPWDTAALNPTN